MKLTSLWGSGILQRLRRKYRLSKSIHFLWYVVVTRSLDLQKKGAMTIAEPLQRICGRSVAPMWSWWLHGRMGMGDQWPPCMWHIGKCHHWMMERLFLMGQSLKSTGWIMPGIYSVSKMRAKVIILMEKMGHQGKKSQGAGKGPRSHFLYWMMAQLNFQTSWKCGPKRKRIYFGHSLLTTIVSSLQLWEGQLDLCMMWILQSSMTRLGLSTCVRCEY